MARRRGVSKPGGRRPASGCPVRSQWNNLISCRRGAGKRDGQAARAPSDPGLPDQQSGHRPARGYAVRASRSQRGCFPATCWCRPHPGVVRASLRDGHDPALARRDTGGGARCAFWRPRLCWSAGGRVVTSAGGWLCACLACPCEFLDYDVAEGDDRDGEKGAGQAGQRQANQRARHGFKRVDL